MMLSTSDITDLTALRRDLHRHPEVSGHEAQTARRILSALDALAPDDILTDLGGHGIAAIYNAPSPGPTLLFRAELDALPILEMSDAAHCSAYPGTGHLCGHDGHMTILMGLARLLSRQRSKRGRVILMFQPAEETGAGAQAVISDPRFDTISPEFAFSLHNMPGLPLGHVGLADGPVNCASRGLLARLTGKTAHASEPENGISPMDALCSLMPALTSLSQGTTQEADFTLVTVTHCSLGVPAVGIAPGDATLMATLRTLTDDRMDALCTTALDLLHNTATQHGLTAGHSFQDIFLHSENHPEATTHIRSALDALGIAHDGSGLPMRASEDFGRFGHTAKSAMLFLGAGVDHAALHNPDYDFPDDLIPIGTRIFARIARDLLG